MGGPPRRFGLSPTMSELGLELEVQPKKKTRLGPKSPKKIKNGNLLF